MDEWLLDARRSHLRVRTRAVGMLARLAHDLEIECGALEARATERDGSYEAELRAPVAALCVVGVLKGDRVDAGVLSAGDRADIDRRLRAEVLGGAREVVVTARGSSRERAEIEVRLPSGAARLEVPLRVRGEGEGELEVHGRAELSLRSLGVAEVKGPLGAFKVRDGVEVGFTLLFRRA